jgi:hypothetical protein
VQHFGRQFEFQACPVLGPAGAVAAAQELDQNIDVIKAAATTACSNIKQTSFEH